MGKGSVIRKLTNHIPKENVIQVAFRLLGIDGGPGSGNWGHRGRPGLVGGSGPGGGNLYRGGRKEIGYFSSKKDWLNGLSGEEQHRASQLLKKSREEIPNYSEMTPEENIMKNGDLNDRRELVSLIGKARNWEKNCTKLIKENLSKEEQKYLSMLSASIKGPLSEDDNLDNHFEDMWAEEKRFYNDLKMKACGFPNSGRGLERYSDELLYKIGAKEKPKTSSEKNSSWLDDYVDSDWNKRNITDLVFMIGPAVFKDDNGKYDMNDAENRIQQAVIRKLAEGNKHTLNYLRSYIYRKDDYLKINADKVLARGDSEVLNEDQKNFAKNLLKEFAGTLPDGETVESRAYLAEERMFKSNDVPDFVKAYYLGLKMRVLGLTDSTPEEYLLEKVWGQPSRDLLPTLKYNRPLSITEKRAQQKENYKKVRNEGKIVIPGDELSEGVDKLRKDGGTYTHDEVQKVGSLVYTHYKKEYDRRHNAISKLQKKMDEAWEVYRKADREAWDEERGSQAWQEKKAKANELYKKYAEFREKKESKQEEEKKVISDILSRIRKTGIDDPKVMKEHFSNRSPNKKYVEEAYQRYPTEWVQASIDFGRVAIYKKQRGCYDTTEIDLDGEGERIKQVATHELGHRFEEVIPGIKEAEKEFYDRRTQGEPSVKLRILTGNRGYRSDEVAKKDNFVNPYIGKDYKGSWYEVVSMGFQYAFNEPSKLMKDPDYAKFILGLLAVA